MTQLEGLAGEISQLSISHGKVENNEQWEEVLKSHDPGFDYSLTKVLVFKPKTPKTQTPVPLVFVSLNSTKAPSGVLAKAAGVKEPRLASPELVAEFFNGTATSDVCPLSIKKEHGPKIKLVVDAKIAHQEKIAIHTQSSADTAFITGNQLLDYYSSIGIEPVVVDFEAEASTPAAPSVTNANPPPSGKIEGAALIGITSDKDLDFPGWYQQVLTKARCWNIMTFLVATLCVQLPSMCGRLFRLILMKRSNQLVFVIARSQCLFHPVSLSEKRTTLRALPLKLPG